MHILLAGQCHDINESQLSAMLAGDKPNSICLEGWEAFKNFFIKLLNHLPHINLVDKEATLEDIYKKIYGKDSSSAYHDRAHSIEDIWPALNNLIELMEYTAVNSMRFRLVTDDNSPVTDLYHPPISLNLSISINNHTLTKIPLSTSPLHFNMLLSVIRHNMERVADGTTESYQLNHNVLMPYNNGVCINPYAMKETHYGYDIARAIEQSRLLAREPVTDFANPYQQLAYLSKYKVHTERLELLKTEENIDISSYINAIDIAIEDLKFSERPQQAHFKEINSQWVKSLVDHYAALTANVDLLDKKALDEDLSRLSALCRHKETLLHHKDEKRLQQITSELNQIRTTVNLKKKSSK